MIYNIDQLLFIRPLVRVLQTVCRLFEWSCIDSARHTLWWFLNCCMHLFLCLVLKKAEKDVYWTSHRPTMKFSTKLKCINNQMVIKLKSRQPREMRNRSLFLISLSSEIVSRHTGATTCDRHISYNYTSKIVKIQILSIVVHPSIFVASPVHDFGGRSGNHHWTGC